MVDYEKLYRMIFNAMTDAHSLISDGRVIEGLHLMEKAQQDAEEQYVGDDES